MVKNAGYSQGHIQSSCSKSHLEAQEVAIFPLIGIGVNPAAGEISLSGKDYDVISITLNSDELPTRVRLDCVAGAVTLSASEGGRFSRK